MSKEKRDNYIIIRVTKEEKDKIVIDSKKRYFTISQWVRRLLTLDK